MRQWAILIGLNHYQLFQPLNCAQQDAQALHQYLIEQAGFPAEQCLLLTDTSPQISSRSTQPTRANLQSWIEFLTHQCFKPGDMLWFFFSGYGVCAQGRDYLVPLDGDPFAVETTCILMSDIFSRLQAALSPGLPLVLLDMNRSQGNFSNEQVGTQTVRLAKQLAVPALLSCQPGQYSREISGLGHGLFTVALLEALKYHQAATPETLMRFLYDRLPELGEHYFVPNQQPLATCPPDKLHQPLLQTHFTNHWNGALNGNGLPATQPADVTAFQPISPKPDALPTATAIAEPAPVPTAYAVAGSSPLYPPPPSAHAAVTDVTQPPLPPPRPSSEPVMKESSETITDAGGGQLWRSMLLGGTLISLVLVGCVLWRNWGSILGPNTATRPATGMGAPVPGTAPAPETLRAASADLGTPANPAAANPGTSVAPMNPASPTNANVLTFNPSPAPPSNQAILQNARLQVMSDQATPYRNAIDAALQIPASDPLYAEAQQEIAAWSQRIFEISQQRAALQQWDIAIMAASLVPEGDRKLHPQAQALITEWCPALLPQPADSFTRQKARAICTQKPI
jgi:hypothetical protein